MRADLECRTPELTFALFDPAVLRSASDLSRNGVERECSAGNILLIDTDEPGCSCRLLLGEEMDPEVTARAEKIAEHVLLRVPVGRIVLTTRKQVRTVAKQGSFRADAMIPAGTYLLDAYSIDTDPPPDYFRTTLGLEEYARWHTGCKAQVAGCFMGILAIAILAVAAGVGIAGLPWLGLALGVLGAVAFNWRWSPSQRRVRAAYASAKESWERKFPSGVLDLRRQPDGMDLTGCKGAKVYFPT